MNRLERLQTQGFIPTKEYQRFVEFCQACRRERYIGLCYGSAGVGKTVSAEVFSRWPLIDTLIEEGPKGSYLKNSKDCRSILYTPNVANSPTQIRRELESSQYRLNLVSYWHDAWEDGYAVDQLPRLYQPDNVPATLLIVDEADRLKVQSIEELRDIHDRLGIGLILIGMPGLEKKIARFAQFYSRVGFIHEFRPLGQDEVKFILERRWQALNVKVNMDRFQDVEAVSAFIRITRGNFRLMNRLLTQIQRLMEINQLTTITLEVVEAARDMLVIGAV